MGDLENIPYNSSVFKIISVSKWRRKNSYSNSYILQDSNLVMCSTDKLFHGDFFIYS